MQSIPTNCPRCEASNPFRPLQRSIGDNRIEIYIRCPTCHWEQILYASTPEIERLRRKEHRWEAHGKATLAKHGVKSTLARSQVTRIRARIRELQDEIE